MISVKNKKYYINCHDNYIENFSELFKFRHFLKYLSTNKISKTWFKFIKDILALDETAEIDFLNINITRDFLDFHLNSDVQYNNSPYFRLVNLDKPTYLENIALIQCFYGLDEKRILATKRGLAYILMSNPLSAEWIFIEAQKNESDCVFKYLEYFGAKHIFVKINPENENFFIKEALWNIGEHYSKSKYLIFLDADVAFCQNDWMINIYQEFIDGKQLFQPFSYSYRAGEKSFKKDEWNLKNNICYSTSNWLYNQSYLNNLKFISGHTGYGLCMSKNYYKKINGFYPIQITGFDYIFWNCAILNIEYINNNKLLPYQNFDVNLLKNYKIDDFSILGCVENICFHNSHDDILKRNYDENMIKYRKNNKYFYDNVNYNPMSYTLPKLKNKCE